jgi:transcriptional regulator with XRE-family HTH domain
MPEINLKEIGKRIRYQRELLGYTREDLAEALNITSKFCADIELGQKGMSLQTLYNISNILKITTDYILGGDDIDSDVAPAVNMLKTCDPDKLKYANDIIKSFVLAIN